MDPDEELQKIIESEKEKLLEENKKKIEENKALIDKIIKERDEVMSQLRTKRN